MLIASPTVGEISHQCGFQRIDDKKAKIRSTNQESIDFCFILKSGTAALARCKRIPETDSFASSVSRPYPQPTDGGMATGYDGKCLAKEVIRPKRAIRIADRTCFARGLSSRDGRLLDAGRSNPEDFRNLQKRFDRPPPKKISIYE